MKKRDLKLAAFIVSAGTTLFLMPLIIHLAWMIPMTVHIWKAYKKELRITPRFIICSTIFLFNPVISILLLYSENKFTRRRWAYYCAIFADICSAIFVIPLAWMIPFTVKLNKTTSAEWEPTIAFKICYLIFL